MAAGIGLAASLNRVAAVGVQIITGSHGSAGSESRANPDMADLVSGVQLTADALERAGKECEWDDGARVASQKAVQDADSLVRRCNDVFAEVQQVLETRRAGRETIIDSANDAPKDPRIALLGKRLENLKSGATLLSEMLHSSNRQGVAETEGAVHEGTRNRHLHQQRFPNDLRTLELKLDQALRTDDELLEDHNTPSRVPTIDLMINASNSDPRVPSSNQPSATLKAPATAPTLREESETPGTEQTVTDDDVEYISTQQLSKCAGHVDTLFKRIDAIQKSLEGAAAGDTYPKHRLEHLYRRFCRRFEAEMDGSRGSPRVGAEPLPIVAEPTRRTNHNTLPNVPDSPRNPHQLAAFGSGPHEMPSVRPVVQPYLSHNEKVSHDPHMPSVYGEHGKSHLHEAGVQSEGSSREASKEGFSNPPAEDDGRPFQPGGIHRTKTGRISKAKKGLKVHSCECGKSYTRAEHLRRHQKNHTSDDVVCCDLCGKTFYRRDLLERHMGRHKERLTTHKGDMQFSAMPGSHRSGEQFSMSPDTPVADSIHPFQSATGPGPRWGSTSSEASSPWIIPPRSVSHADNSGQMLARNPESQQLPSLGSAHLAAQTPQAAGAPISPPPNGQSHHTPTGGSHLRIHTNIPPISRSRIESDILHPPPGRAVNAPLGNDPIGPPSSSALPHPPRMYAEVDESPPSQGPNAPDARTLQTQAAAPDTISPRKGFTPVNAVRDEWFSPVHHQSTSSKERVGRTSTYNPDQRLLASQTRSISPCANCTQLKHKCDADTPCSNCRKFAQRSGYLPDPTCRGRSYMAHSPRGQAAEQSVVTSKAGIEGVQRNEIAIPSQVHVASSSNVQPKPADEILQRLVKEAGSNKQLEMSRADRKAFFDDHWSRSQEPTQEPANLQSSNPAEAPASSGVKSSTVESVGISSSSKPAANAQPATGTSVEAPVNNPSEGATKPAMTESKATARSPVSGTEAGPLQSRLRSRSMASPTKDEEASRSKAKTSVRRRRGPSGRLTADTATVTESNKLGDSTKNKEEDEDSTPSPFKKDNKNPKKQQVQFTDATSPPPEPADKTSEEWISWKRARLSEGTRKRKRERGETGSAEVEVQQRKKSKGEA